MIFVDEASVCHCIQKELQRRREAEERKRRREEEEQRLRKLNEERVMLEEKELEQMRCEVEKMEEMEREKSRRAEEQQRRLAEAMELAKKEREQKLQQETERLARKEEERQKKCYRKVVEKETEELLKNQNRWYYEGSNTDWREDRQRSTGKLAGQQAAYGEVPHLNKLAPLRTYQQDDADIQICDREPGLRPEHSPSCREIPTSPPGAGKSRKTFPSERRTKRRPKSPAKKSTSVETELTAVPDEPASDYGLTEFVENFDTGVVTKDEDA